MKLGCSNNSAEYEEFLRKNPIISVALSGFKVGVVIGILAVIIVSLPELLSIWG